MSAQCFISGCKEIVLAGCSCSNTIYMCESHTSSHIYSYGKHNIKKIYFKSEDTQNNLLIEYLIKNKKVVRDSIKKVKVFTGQIINSIINHSNCLIKDLEYRCEIFYQNLKILMNRSLINIELFEKVNKSKINIEKPWAIKSNDLEKSIQSAFNINSTKNLVNDDEFAVIFLSTIGRNVQLIDLNNYKSQIVDMSLNDLVQYCGCCRIKDNKYFVYGGNNPSLSSAKIIDIKQKKTKVLPSNIPISFIAACLFNEEVYTFGGHNSGALSNCFKFNLESKSWKPLQSLPVASHDNTASTFNKAIYITGYECSRIFKYNHMQNNFSSLGDTLAVGWKVILKKWLVCFGKCLYEIDKNENLINRQAFGDSGANNNSSAYFKRGKYLYFVICTPKLYRICTETKKIELINIT